MLGDDKALRGPGIGPIPLPRAIEIDEGAAIAVALRPEKLVITRRPPDGFAIMATVTAVDYQGPVSILRLAVKTREHLTAQLPSTAAAGLGRGDVVWASWAREDMVVISR
jgi:ABC-type Fe3+/spermidine/putrescine transport system ATPase subunit